MLAFINIFPHLFAISGNQAYQDPPYCKHNPIYNYGSLVLTHPPDSVGNSAALGMTIMMFVCSLILRWYLGFLNAKKKANQFSPQAAEMREKSLEEIGDHHPGMLTPYSPITLRLVF